MSRTQTPQPTGRYFWPLLFLLLISSNGCSKQEQATYVIGYVGSQAGANGAHLAAGQATASKSSPYKTVEIIGIDADAGDFTAEKALKSLSSAGARIIIDDSGSLLGTTPKAGGASILSTAQNQKVLATINAPLESAAAKMADQLWADKIFSVSIVYDLADRSYNWKWVNAFRSRYEKFHGVVLKAETINSLQEGWEKKLPDLLKEALLKESRCLVVVAETGAAGLIVQEARNLNKTIPLALAEQALPAVLLGKAGKNLEGATMVDFPPTDSSAESYERFIKEYAGKFKGPANLTAATAYDAVGLIVAALGKGKGIDDGLAAQTEYQGILGTARNNVGTYTREARLGRISNGRLAPIPAAPSKNP